MPSSPRDETWHRRLTQNRTGVRRDEICMAHPMAGVAMTFPNTWLNECLHSVKKIDQWVRFREREVKKKSVFHRDRNQSVQREKREERVRGGWETAGDIRYRVCMCVDCSNVITA